MSQNKKANNISLGEFLSKCGFKFLERNKIYKNSWQKMSLNALTSFVVGKAERIQAMAQNGCEYDKIVDDIEDIVCYCYMIYAKLQQNNEENEKIFYFNTSGGE